MVFSLIFSTFDGFLKKQVVAHGAPLYRATKSIDSMSPFAKGGMRDFGADADATSREILKSRHPGERRGPES